MALKYIKNVIVCVNSYKEISLQCPITTVYFNVIKFTGHRRFIVGLNDCNGGEGKDANKYP